MVDFMELQARPLCDWSQADMINAVRKYCGDRYDPQIESMTKKELLYAFFKNCGWDFVNGEPTNFYAVDPKKIEEYMNGVMENEFTDKTA